MQGEGKKLLIFRFGPSGSLLGNIVTLAFHTELCTAFAGRLGFVTLNTTCPTGISDEWAKQMKQRDPYLQVKQPLLTLGALALRPFWGTSFDRGNIAPNDSSPGRIARGLRVEVLKVDSDILSIHDIQRLQNTKANCEFIQGNNTTRASGNVAQSVVSAPDTYTVRLRAISSDSLARLLSLRQQSFPGSFLYVIDR